MKQNVNKIILEKSADLLKYSYNDLERVDIRDFKGKYFDEIYKEAIKIEKGELKMPNINNYKKQNIFSMEDNNKNLDNYNYQNNINNHYNSQNNYKNNNSNLYSNNKNQESEHLYNYITDNRNTYSYPLNKISFYMKYETSYGENVGILGSNDALGKWDVNHLFKLEWTQGHIWTGYLNINQFNMEDFEFKFVIIENNQVKRWENGNNNKVNFKGLLNEVKNHNKGKYNKYEYEYNNNELKLKCFWTG